MDSIHRVRNKKNMDPDYSRTNLGETVAGGNQKIDMNFDLVGTPYRFRTLSVEPIFLYINPSLVGPPI